MKTLTGRFLEYLVSRGLRQARIPRYEGVKLYESSLKPGSFEFSHSFDPEWTFTFRRSTLLIASDKKLAMRGFKVTRAAWPSRAHLS